MNVNDTKTPLLSVQNVAYQIGDKVLLKDISFDIYRDEIVSLIGPNGAGKSTLVKLILGLATPTTGNINFDGKLVIGYVPQKFAVPTILPLQVKDLLAQTQKNRLTPQEKQMVFDALSVEKLFKSQVATLSGGELQRVLLAKALLDKPDLLVLDEPMQGLDPEAQTLLYGLIDALPAFLKCTMLVVSHDLHWVMAGTKQVICLNKHICCMGKPADIASLPAFTELFGQYVAKSQTPYIHTHTHCQHH